MIWIARFPSGVLMNLIVTLALGFSVPSTEVSASSVKVFVIQLRVMVRRVTVSFSESNDTTLPEKNVSCVCGGFDPSCAMAIGAQRRIAATQICVANHARTELSTNSRVA